MAIITAESLTTTPYVITRCCASLDFACGIHIPHNCAAVNGICNRICMNNQFSTDTASVYQIYQDISRYWCQCPWKPDHCASFCSWRLLSCFVFCFFLPICLLPPPPYHFHQISSLSKHVPPKSLFQRQLFLNPNQKNCPDLTMTTPPKRWGYNACPKIDNQRFFQEFGFDFYWDAGVNFKVTTTLYSTTFVKCTYCESYQKT